MADRIRLMKTKLLKTAISLVAIVLMGSTAAAAGLDQYGGYTGIKGSKTGFFHHEIIDGMH